MTEQELIELCKKQSCKVKVGSLSVYSKLKPQGIGVFTTGKVSEYNTIFLNEIGIYEASWNILEVEINGKMIPITKQRI